MLTAELLIQRNKLKNEMRSLLDKVRGENRQFTEQEETRWAAIKKELAAISDFLDEEERQKKQDQFWSAPAGQAGEPAENKPESARQAAAGLRTIQAPNGREIRCFSKGARLYDHLDFQLPDGIRKEDLNLGRWMRGVVTGDWSGAEAEKRAQGIGSGSVGGYLVPTPLSARIIDLARNQARVLQAGAQIIPMESAELTVGRIDADPAAYWVPENVAGTFGDMTLGAYVLKAKKIMALARSSVELIEDGQNVAEILESALSNALALELDRACLYGAGAGGEPQGIKGSEGVQEVDMGDNGGALTDYSKFSEALEKVQSANGPADGISIILNPRELGTLDRLVETGTGQPLNPPESWKRMAKYATNQIPKNLTKGSANNASDAFVGDFSQLWIGMRTAVSIEVSRDAAAGNDSAFTQHQLWLKATLRADVMLAWPSWFVIIDGIIPAAG